MMRKYFLILFILSSALPCYGVAQPACSVQDVDKIVHELGYVVMDNHLKELQCLSAHPQEAANELIAQLHVVSEKKVMSKSQGEHKDTMHVVWSLRGLRYITGGMDFTAPSSISMDRLGRAHKNFLTIRNKSELTFFGTTMAQDTLYFAPQDVQTAVIEKWKTWYKEQNASFSYKPAKSSMDWYF